MNQQENQESKLNSIGQSLAVMTSVAPKNESSNMGGSNRLEVVILSDDDDSDEDDDEDDDDDDDDDSDDDDDDSEDDDDDDDDSDNEDDNSILYVSTPSLSARGTDTRNRNIPVESYRDDDIDLNRAIVESPVSSSHGSDSTGNERRAAKRVIDLSFSDDSDDDVEVISWSPPKKILKGESSNSKQNADGNKIRAGADHTFMCDICVDEKPKTSIFNILGCTHSYCSNCMVKYVASKLQENVTDISCPVSGCRGRLEPEHCRSILPPEVFNRWGDVLCESLISASERFYCPFKDCSALLIDDRSSSNQVIRQSECPYCRRLFCVECRVPWHPDMSCEEFKKLNEDERQSEDIMLINLAKEKNWRRCPRCKFYVEKTEGCLFMKCRCKFAFCYNCGSAMTGMLGHYCENCKH